MSDLFADHKRIPYCVFHSIYSKGFERDFTCYQQVEWSDVADPHHFDPDPDPTFHVDADPDPTFHFDADPFRDPSFQKKA
jgi:hypothetical protein